ncbi:MAG: hypothetical protein WDZ52_03520 [Pseudohongiellaceae bacterium]
MQSPQLIRTLKLYATFCAACAALLSLEASAQGFSFSQLSVNAGHESNVPRGRDGPHEQESSFLAAEYSIGRLYELGLKNTFVIGGAVSAARFNDLRGFDRAGLSVSANYNYKWALGAYAPVLSLSTSYALEQYEGSARDNDLLRLDIAYLRRLSPAWFVTLGIDYQNSGSDSLTYDPVIESFGYDPEMGLPSEIYDYDSNSVYGDIEYAFANGMLVNAGYRRVNGFTVSSTTQPTLALYKVSDAVYTDPAFDGAWIAYLLEADTNEWSLGLSIPSGVDSSINFAYSFYDIKAVSGNSYLNRIFSASYVHNF